MALTPRGYATKQDVEDALHMNLDPAYDAALDDLIAKAEARVEAACRRRFDSEVGVRYVSARGGTLLHIPDATDITTVTVDPLHTAPYLLGVEGYDWVAEPLDGRPFNRLVLVNGRTFPTVGTVQIEGTFGFPAVPPTITHATVLLVAEVTRRWRMQHAGDAQSIKLGDYSVTFADRDMDSMTRSPSWRKWVLPHIKTRAR